MFILFVLKINRLQTFGNGTENFFVIDDDEHLSCLMALASLSKVKPNGVFIFDKFRKFERFWQNNVNLGDTDQQSSR
ncbi:hypothetical protein Nmel_013457 [Mimus melanotis]